MAVERLVEVGEAVAARSEVHFGSARRGNRAAVAAGCRVLAQRPAAGEIERARVQIDRAAVGLRRVIAQRRVVDVDVRRTGSINTAAAAIEALIIPDLRTIEDIEGACVLHPQSASAAEGRVAEHMTVIQRDRAVTGIDARAGAKERPRQVVLNATVDQVQVTAVDQIRAATQRTPDALEGVADHDGVTECSLCIIEV